MNNKIIVWDCVFVMWFITDALFNHSIIGTLGLLLFVAYSLFRCVQLQRYKLSTLFLFYGLFCISCYLTIQLGYAVEPSRSKSMLNVLFRNYIFIFCVYQYIYSGELNHFFSIFKYTCLLSSIFMMAFIFIQTGTIFMRDDSVSINANMMSVMDGFIVGLMLLFKQTNTKNLFVMAFLLFFILLSGTRKSVITIIVLVGCYILLNNPKHIIRNTFTLVCLAIISYILLIKVPLIYDLIGNRFESMFSFLQGGETDSSTNTRGRFIEIGLLYWNNSPIFGNGLNSFGYLWGDDTYSHNNYVELLCSAGVVGLISFYLIYAYPLWLAIKSFFRVKNIYSLLIISIVVACLVNEYGLVTYFERTPYIMIVYIYMLLNRIKLSRSYY